MAQRTEKPPRSGFKRNRNAYSREAAAPSTIDSRSAANHGSVRQIGRTRSSPPPLPAAMTVAAAQLGMTGFAQAQASKTKLPGVKPGTNTSFAPLKEIDAGVLNV